MAKVNNKKMKGLLKTKKKQEVNGRGEDVRVTKQNQIKQLKGWAMPVKDWEGQVSKNLDKLVKEIKKGYDIDEDTVGELTTNVMRRVKLYEEVAELTGVPLNMGEATWAIQYEYIYQRQLFKQDTTTEESRRDVNVHNLKYLIEQAYNRHGNPAMEELKQLVYDKTDVSKIPSTQDKAELEVIYTTILEESVNELKQKYKK